MTEDLTMFTFICGFGHCTNFNGCMPLALGSHQFASKHIVVPCKWSYYIL